MTLKQDFPFISWHNNEKKCPVSGAFEPSAMREKVYGWNKKEVIFMLRSVLPIHDVFRDDNVSSLLHLHVTHPQVSSMYTFYYRPFSVHSYHGYNLYLFIIINKFWIFEDPHDPCFETDSFAYQSLLLLQLSFLLPFPQLH